MVFIFIDGEPCLESIEDGDDDDDTPPTVACTADFEVKHVVRIGAERCFYLLVLKNTQAAAH